MVEKIRKIDSLRSDKAEATRAARELGYSQETIDAIKKATSPFQIDRIMITARHSMKEYWYEQAE